MIKKMFFSLLILTFYFNGISQYKLQQYKKKTIKKSSNISFSSIDSTFYYSAIKTINLMKIKGYIKN